MVSRSLICESELSWPSCSHSFRSGGGPGIEKAAAQTVGPLYHWGDDSNGVGTVPSGNFKQVASGRKFAIGVRENGSLAGWGLNTDGQTNVPESANFVAVSCGWDHSLALQTDGTVVAWGKDGSWLNVPSGLTATVVAAGEYVSLALRSNGTIAIWGQTSGWTIPSNDPGMYIALSAGAHQALAITAGGTLVAFGPTSPECNCQSGETNAGTVPIGVDEDFIAIGSIHCHSFAIRANGTILGWGCGNLCNVLPPPSGTFTQVSGGYQHGLAMRTNSTTAAWGASGDFCEHKYGQGQVPLELSLIPILRIGPSHSSWFNLVILAP
ncbi:MAG: RCC1 domain-containing protein [Phycisphaerales bacterium]